MSLPTTKTATPSSSSSSAATTTTTTATAYKTYSGKDKACECFVSFYIITLLTIIFCATPAITRLLIFLQPNFSDFSVDSSTLSVRNVSSTAITADWKLTLSSTNPNKNTIFYKTISAVALKDNTLALSAAVIPPFSQKGFQRKRVEIAFSGTVAEKLNCTENDISCGMLNLKMDLRASASYGGWTWPVKEDKIKVVCGRYEVDCPVNVTTLKFGSSNCSVNGKWKRMVENCTRIFWNYVFIATIVLGILALSL